ncbi:unnamed protein product [Mucor hiemalis]
MKQTKLMKMAQCQESFKSWTADVVWNDKDLIFVDDEGEEDDDEDDDDEDDD